MHKISFLNICFNFDGFNFLAPSGFLTSACKIELIKRFTYSNHVVALIAHMINNKILYLFAATATSFYFLSLSFYLVQRTVQKTLYILFSLIKFQIILLCVSVDKKGNFVIANCLEVGRIIDTGRMIKSAKKCDDQNEKVSSTQIPLKSIGTVVLVFLLSLTLLYSVYLTFPNLEE